MSDQVPGAVRVGAVKADLTRRLSVEVLIPVVLLALVFVAWGVVVAVFNFPRYVLPKPAAVLHRMWEERRPLLDNAVATGAVAAGGLLFSVAIGVPMGLAIGRWRAARRILMPPIVAIQSIPKVALAPLFVVWLGFGALPKLIITVLITFFPLVLATVVGVEALPLRTVHLARSMGCRGTKFLRHVLLPTAAPYVSAAFRTSATLAVVGALVAEFVGSANGLGNYLLVQSGNHDTEGAFGAILVVAVLGIVFYAGSALLARVATMSLGSKYMRSVA
jgi:NitT/TauT family transport system permease protein